jgi:hypothetical protein
MAGPKATNAAMRSRTKALLPLVGEGLTTSQIRARAAQKPCLAWVRTITDPTLRTYMSRADTMAIADPAAVRAAVVDDVTERLAECRRLLEALEAKLKLVGIDDHAV